MFGGHSEEEALHRKLFRIGRNAALAVGGGVGLWFVGFLFPDQGEQVDKIRALMPLLSGWAISYGFLMFAVLLFLRKFAIFLNGCLVWLATPAVLLFALLKAI